MERVRTDAVDGLTVADVMHDEFEVLPASATIEASTPAIERASAGPALAPDAPAAAGRDVVVGTASRRAPVVAGDGCLVGVLAMTRDLQFFACRAPTGER